MTSDEGYSQFGYCDDVQKSLLFTVCVMSPIYTTGTGSKLKSAKVRHTQKEIISLTD